MYLARLGEMSSINPKRNLSTRGDSIIEKSSLPLVIIPINGKAKFLN